jgi:nucleotide-binding universal stress UspA family protein
MSTQASPEEPVGTLNESEIHSLKLRTILAATDLSPNSLVALQHACDLAKLTQGTIVVLHVFELPTFASKPEIYFSSRDATFEVEETQNGVLERLHAIRDEIVYPQVPCSSSMRIGAPYEEIIDEADERRADLIVVGTRGMSGVSRFLMGSTAERVCRYAACSVLVVPHKPASHLNTTRKLKLRKILVPTDLSENSLTAINFAAGLAKSSDAQLTLFHVFQIPDCTAAQSDIAAAQCCALDRLHSLRETVTASGGKCDAGMRTGVPYQEIVEQAQKIAPDLIVVGTHGATGIARRLMGTTAERVLRHAPCPVLVARNNRRMPAKRIEEQSQHWLACCAISSGPRC